MLKFKVGDVLIYTGVLDGSNEERINKVCVVEGYWISKEYSIKFREDGKIFSTCREGNLKLASKEIKLFED